MMLRPQLCIAAFRLFAASSLFTAVAAVGEGQQEAAPERPKYDRVNGEIEVLWQRPDTPGRAVRGIVFGAHGCNHQGTDWFEEVGPDGHVFKDCRASYFGRCLGLPEERQLFEVARRRGYLVASVSGGRGQRSCWAMADVEHVETALRHIITVEGLQVDVPILAMGASSGGQFVGGLAAFGTLGPQLRCIVPQISTIDTRGSVPTLFVHMDRDPRTAAGVKEQIVELRRRGVRAEELVVRPAPVALVMAQRFPPMVAAEIAQRLARKGLVDGAGQLMADPRGSNWRVALQAMSVSLKDNLKSDESRVSELMNVAWAHHELSAQHAEEMLDFCEGRSVGA